MILVDTSIWITHLRQGDRRLTGLLEETAVSTHPFVIGELALGRLRQRDEILKLLDNLPSATVASHEEVMVLIERHELVGTGIGWVDAHLLASALLTDNLLWTLDRRLATVAKELGVAHPS